MPITMVDWLARMRKLEADKEGPNERGNVVRRGRRATERYIVDFAVDFRSEGWLQFDTDQDAPYFGFWVNPGKLLTLTYAEGDWRLVECPTKETYNAEIEDACRFYDEGRIATVIDTKPGPGFDGATVTVYRQDRKLFLIP